MVNVGIAEALRGSLLFVKIRSSITVSHFKKYIQPVSPNLHEKNKHRTASFF